MADATLPIGDLIYIGGMIVLSVASLAIDRDSIPEILSKADSGYGSSPPNDDDDDDDYYNNESNFGGRQKIGKPKGKTPGNNQKQNQQFRDATRGLNKDQQKLLHNQITKEGQGFHEILELTKDMIIYIVVFFSLDE